MTENEAIRDLQYLIEEYSAYPPETGVSATVGSLQYCISALKEIYQYREIGTVEECKELASMVSTEKKNALGKIVDEWNEYIEIGTVEECREAVEKQKLKTPGRTGMDEQDCYICPNCGADIGSIDDYFPRDRYCHECGQAIQWNENLEGIEDE